MTVSVGDFRLKPQVPASALQSLSCKASALPQPLRRRGPTLVTVTTESLPVLAGVATPQPERPPNARERRAERSSQQRRQQQRISFSDSAAFAYLKGWPLKMRITVAWDACMYGDRREGHVLGQPDKERGSLLRDALWRHLRKHGEPFACIWARDTGGRHGQHIHLAQYWPRPAEELAWLLAGLTGSLPSSDSLPRDVVAQSCLLYTSDAADE